MPQAIVTLPDGQRAKVTFDNADQLDKTVSDLVEAHPVKFGHMDPRTGHVRGVNDVIGEAVGEPAAKAITGTLAAAAGGVAGLARGVGAGAASLAMGEGNEKARQAFTNEAVDTLEKVEGATTYQPRSKIGKAATRAVEYPFQLLAKGADVAGAKTAEVTGSPAAGAVVNTAIQAAPAVVLKAFGRKPGVSGEGAPPRPPPNMSASGGARTPPSEVGAPLSQPPPQAPTAPPDMSASGAPRSAPSDVGSPQPSAPSQPPSPPPDMTATGAPRAPATDVGGGPVPRGTPEGRAQAYARTLGLDWARLGAGTKKALTTIAQDATALDRLNPEAVKRQAHLQSLRVPVQATRGQLERDPVQLRREAIASNTTEGQPIRDVDIAANRDLQANLEVLRGRAAGRRGDFQEPVNEEGQEILGALRGPTGTPSEVGTANQTALRAKQRWSQQKVRAAYDIARKTEPDAETAFKPVADLLEQSPEISHLGWVQGWMSRIGRAARTHEGADPSGPITHVTLRELDDLDKKATGIQKGGGTEGYYAGEVKKAIQTAMQDVPEGARAWRLAKQEFIRHQNEFENQAGVKALVTNKGGRFGRDPTVAAERTWQRVATGSLENLRQVKRSLTTGGTAETRMAGRRAWRQIRAETVNRILEDARNVTSADETERAILTEAALRRSINRIPRENLEELLGRANVRELYNILRARRITTRSPVGGRTTQSGTVPNTLVLMERVLKHLGPVGRFAVGAKHAIGDLAERGAAARTVKEATVSPVEQAARDVERMSAKRARRAAYETLEQSGPTLPQGAPPQPLPIGPATKPLGSRGPGTSQRGGPKFEPTIKDVADLKVSGVHQSGKPVSGEIGGVPVMSSSIEEYRKNPQLLVDHLLEVIGDSGQAIGLRGIYKDELGVRELPASFDNRQGIESGSQRLEGTSVIGLTGDWSYDPEALIENFKRYASGAEKFGDTDYLAVVEGRPSIDDIANDPGEFVLRDARALVYIPRKGK